jgi:hypothetical protein
VRQLHDELLEPLGGVHSPNHQRFRRSLLALLRESSPGEPRSTARRSSRSSRAGQDIAHTRPRPIPQEYALWQATNPSKVSAMC